MKDLTGGACLAPEQQQMATSGQTEDFISNLQAELDEAQSRYERGERP